MTEPYFFRGMVVRPDMRAALDKYARNRHPIGGFLTAVCSNDLHEACGRADEGNAPNLPAFVAYLYNECPSACWGSPKKVRAWLAQGPVLDEAES